MAINRMIAFQPIGHGRIQFGGEPSARALTDCNVGAAHPAMLAAWRQRFEIVLDNTHSNQEFNCIFQGEDMTVPANLAETLTSMYPIVVRFDRGNGTDFVTRTTPLTVGNLQVGVSASDNLWDLFSHERQPREASNLKPFNADLPRKHKLRCTIMGV